MTQQTVKWTWTAGFILAMAWSAVPGTAAELKSAEPNPAAWSGRMQSVRQTLLELLVDLSSTKRFESAEGRARVRANAQKLTQLAHGVQASAKTAPDPDPSVKIFGSLFADEAKDALDALNKGRMEYARERLRALPGYCIACHTRTPWGASFTNQPQPAALKSLSPAEKGEYFAASRQFDEALGEYRSLLSSPQAAKSSPNTWADVARHALAIAVRVKEDSKLAFDILDQILANPHAPFSIQDEAGKWKTSVQKWMEEGRKDLSTPEALSVEANRLLEHAGAAQKFPADHAGDIDYLRASAVIHQILQNRSLVDDPKKAQFLAQGYYLAGVCYDALRSFKIGELNELYFAACVKAWPHSEEAERCYRQYEAIVFERHSGSAGMHLAAGVSKRLKALETQARRPAAPTQSGK